MNIHCKYDALVPIDSLKPHPKNRNAHPDEQISRLAKILKYQGLRAPVVVSNLSKCIVKGHGTLMAIRENGWKEVPVVYQDFEDTDQEWLFVQSDNAIAAWAELDLSGINLDIPELGPFDIDLLGIKDFVVEPADKDGECDADDVPEARSTDIRVGDLFSLGNHRLLCGDSTSKESVERLMNGEKADMVFTDPPYGMNLDTDYSQLKKKQGHKGKKFDPVIGDDQDFDAGFLIEFFKDAKELFLWGADYYKNTIPKGGSWVVWDKTLPANGDTGSNGCSSFELCWSREKHERKIFRKEWFRFFGLSNQDVKKRIHPTQKPVEAAQWFFDHWGKEAKLIVDLYLGSGSTLIACEKTNRKCYGMEISPEYVQVVIDRWEKFTGQKAVKLGDA